MNIKQARTGLLLAVGSVVAVSIFAQAPAQQNSPQQGPPGQAGRGRGGRGSGRGGRPGRKVILAWADTRNGVGQHESVGHALATIERIGYESGLYDTYIRTDSNIISYHPLT